MAISADAIVQTIDGPRRVWELVRGPFAGLSGDVTHTSEVGFSIVGEQELVEVITDRGYTIRVTPDVLFTKESGEAAAPPDLEIGDYIAMELSPEVAQQMSINFWYQVYIPTEPMKIWDRIYDLRWLGSEVVYDCDLESYCANNFAIKQRRH